MHVWETASAVFFVYTATLAAATPGLERRARAAGGSVAGLLVAAASLVAGPLLHDWVLPPAVLLIAYWTSGALWTAPMPRAERMLMRFDVAAGVPSTSARMPRALAELLELAYVGVYPLIPIAFALHLLFVPEPDIDRFWTVILVTDFVCFGMLPWVQTRPPRALEERPPWTATVRGFNLKLLGAASIHVNTFPSGHAAEALAAVFLVLGAPLPIVLAMLFIALAISAGTVYGRYHYLADALLGWVVALGVWLAVR
jgi:membrane-associated phospholipid phosphatase